ARGPVLSPPCGADPRPQPAGASRRHPAPGRALPRALLGPSPRPDDPGAETQQGRAVGARRPRLARQRARAPERDRACGRAARARRRSAPRGHPLHRVGRHRPGEAGRRRAGGRRLELLRGPRPSAGPLRPALPDPRGDAGGREPLQSRAPGAGGSDHVLPAHGAARPPAGSLDRRVGVKVARPSATSSPDVSAAPASPLAPVRQRPTPVVRPLAGVTCPMLTAAIRRAEERWVGDRADDDDPDGIPRALAAIGLAVDRRFPSYLLSLEPRPPRLVTQRLLTLVQSELLR